MLNQTQCRDLTDPEILEAARAAILEVLETMFFEVPVEDLDLVETPNEANHFIRTEFRGSLDGVMHVALSCSTCARLTASFLGKEYEEVASPEQCSTALELANMLCGATLSRLEPNGRLTIATPRQAEPHSVAGPWLRYPLDGGDVEVALRIGEVL